MSFDPWNCPLKIQESIGIPSLKVRAHLGVRGFITSHFLTLLGAWNVTLGSLLARTFTSPCFGHEPKARVAIASAHTTFGNQNILITI
jgi:hypothetical protein